MIDMKKPLGKIKVLNLYAGIGGNRKLWENVEVTAIELDKDIAKIYHDFFPDDKVIITDAHPFLLENYEDYDLLWSSPPCPTHSQFRKGFSCNNNAKAVFPDMKLYEEVIFLEGYFKGKYCVENVISYYEPLIKPQILQRHYFWSNFYIPYIDFESDKMNITGGYDDTDDLQIERLEKRFGFDLRKYDMNKTMKRTILRNCVNPKLALYIWDCAFKGKQEVLK